MRFLLCRFLLFLLAISSLVGQTPAGVARFKEAGSVMAPITIELYTDYQCPHCREFFEYALPELMTEFVKTSKVRLIHRDFPLPQFQYSRIAIRYANAAGAIGQYDAVAKQLFDTQPEWAQNGNVEGSVAKILSPADMQKVREMVKNDPQLDEALARDIEMGMNKDHLTGLPTVVITYKGKRETASGLMSYALLKSYLNQKLSQ
jgi:protein-disulfide isomerase